MHPDPSKDKDRVSDAAPIQQTHFKYNSGSLHTPQKNVNPFAARSLLRECLTVAEINSGHGRFSPMAPRHARTPGTAEAGLDFGGGRRLIGRFGRCVEVWTFTCRLSLFGRASAGMELPHAPRRSKPKPMETSTGMVVQFGLCQVDLCGGFS